MQIVLDGKSAEAQEPTSVVSPQEPLWHCAMSPRPEIYSSRIDGADENSRNILFLYHLTSVFRENYLGWVCVAKDFLL